MRAGKSLCLCSFLCLASVSCGAAVQTTDFTDERQADSREPGVVTVVVGNETSLPIAGVQLIVDGERLEIEPGGRPLDVTVEPGEHDLVLDVLLHRDGPPMFASVRGFESMVRGQTRVAVDPGCRLTVRATAHAPDLVHVHPEIRFYYLMDCVLDETATSSL